VLTDNALAYRRGRTWAAVCVALGIRRRFIKPGCPCPNGKPNGSTEPCSPSSPTPRPGPATTNGAPPSTPGSSTTTLNAHTPPITSLGRITVKNVTGQYT
jgi:hypothetical protein